jgi:hypothetical protein
VFLPPAAGGEVSGRLRDWLEVLVILGWVGLAIAES